MSNRQLDDQAAEARDEAAERTDALDQRETALVGKIQTLEAERDELQARATAAMRELGLEQLAPVAMLERMEELRECLATADARNRHSEAKAGNLHDACVKQNQRIEELETELRQSKEATADVIKVSSHWQTQATDRNRRLDALKVRAEDAEAKWLTWMRLHDEAKKEVVILRIRIAAAKRAGKVEELEQQIKALNGELNIANQRSALAETRSRLSDAATARQLVDRASTAESQWRDCKKWAHDLSCQLDAATELVSRGAAERDALRSVLGEVAGRTQDAMLSCQNAVMKINLALKPKGETEGRNRWD